MALLTDMTAFPTLAPVARPDYLATIQVPEYGSKITRIGGVTGQPIVFKTGSPVGVWQPYATHHYSKDQPWNHAPRGERPTMFALENRGGSPSKLILDTETWKPIYCNRPLTASDPRFRRHLDIAEEWRWRPGYSNQAITWVKYRSDGTGNKIILWDVPTDTEIWSATVPVPGPNPAGAKFGMLSEGTMSDDGRYLVLCTAYATPQLAVPPTADSFVVIDFVAKTVGPYNAFLMPYATGDKGNIDFAAISPLGNYVVVKYSDSAVEEYARCFKRAATNVCTPQVHSRSYGLRTDATRSDIYGWLPWISHGDTNVALNGQEFYVGGMRKPELSNFCSTANCAAHGKTVSVDLATGRHHHMSCGTTQLGSGRIERDFQHGSGRAYLPGTLTEPGRGWHLCSHEAMVNGAADERWYTDEIIFWRITSLTHPTRACVRFGTTHTDDSDYFGEAQPCPSPDGTQVAFKSNWLRNSLTTGQAINDTKTYIIEAA